jgi:hypothetical protein
MTDKTRWLLRYTVGDREVADPAESVASSWTLARHPNESDVEYAEAVALYDRLCMGFCRVIAE